MIELKQTKLSVIDTADCGYNGSIARIKKNYLFFYRRGGTRLQSDGNFIHFPHELKFSMLKDNFQPLSAKSIFFTGYNAEDPRIIETQNGFKLFTFREGRVQVQNIEIVTQGSGVPSINISNPKQLTAKNFSFIDIEKNWVPFEHEGKIFIIYCVQPYIVLEMNDDAECWVIHKDQYEFKWPFGRISGGTPAVRINKDEYLTFFHSFTSRQTASWEEPRQYFVGAYTFEARPPFKLKKVTREPLIWEGLLQTHTPNHQSKVIFPAGLMLDGDQLIMTYGENDNWNFVLVLPLKTVLQEMVDIDEGS